MGHWTLRPSRQEAWCLATCAALAALLIHDWDGYVFETAVRQLWAGTTPYETAQAAPWYSLLGPLDHEPQWYAYPPLPLLLMAITFAPAIVLDLPEPVQRLLLKLPVIVGHVALARVAGAWGARRSPEAQATAARWTLWNPFLLLVGPVWGMTDGLLMALLLGGVLAFLNGRHALGGALVGAALLVKPFPVLLGIPLLAWLLARHGRHGIGRATRWAAGTFVIVILPFWASEPNGFWRQVAGAHLARGAQGLTFWRWGGLADADPHLVQVLSMALVALLLAVASWWAMGRRGPDAPIEVLVAAAVAVLLANRVVNEQYLVMVVAPLLILAATQARWRAPALLLTGVLSAAVVLTGFHFLTFIPPDLALPLFGRPVDEVAEFLRRRDPRLWAAVPQAFLYAVPLALVAVAAWLPRPAWSRRVPAAAGPSLLLCALLVAGSTVAAPVHVDDVEFQPAFDTPHVATFYYLWWNNPAHDPGTLYGNWLPVSQSPDIGYYTNNRGIARLHAQQMVDNGIDTAIVSYHRGELPRYEVFQHEAAREGLWVTPLIELNQVYDTVSDGTRYVNGAHLPAKHIHRPVDQNGVEATYAAYRLSQAVEDAIVAFIIDLKAQLAQPSTLRIDGRPVVMFYDAYVSGVSFDAEDRDRLAQALLDTFPIEALRDHYGDPHLNATVADVLKYHPITFKEFFTGPRHAPWRAAHLALHESVWERIKTAVEARTGPLFWISGEAYNEEAGYEAGIPQALVDLEVFDGSFIYSPSFTWGTNQDRPFEETFREWEDRNRWMQAYANGAGRLSVVGIAPAYDDTVNRPHGFVIPAATANGSTYDRSWASATHPPAGMVAIATWNEYFEGSSIEPSKEFGDEWLLATAGHRDRHRAALEAQEQVPRLVMVTSEMQSRTHWSWSETDTAHAWTMDLVAAGVRAYSDHGPYAIDALSRRIALDEADAPALLLIEGARGDHVTSPDVYTRLEAWMPRAPTVIFGPDALGIPMQGAFEPCRPPDVVAEPWTLRPGDRLEGARGELVLVRDGVRLIVGVACDDAPTLTTFKPYGSGRHAVDAQCLDLAVRVLLQGGQGACAA